MKEYEKLPFWDKLSKHEQEHTIEVIQSRHFADKEIIYSPAKECLGMLYIKKGILRVYLTAEDGRTATIFRLRENEVCILSMSCVLPDITFDVEVQAEGDCEVLVIPASYFAVLSKDNVYVENCIYKIMTERFSSMMHAVWQLSFLSLKQRVISFLLDEASYKKMDTIHITQEQLAENIGSAREVVSRVLKGLAQQKLIAVTRGEIQLLDKKELYHLIEASL